MKDIYKSPILCPVCEEQLDGIGTSIADATATHYYLHRLERMAKVDNVQIPEFTITATDGG